MAAPRVAFAVSISRATPRFASASPRLATSFSVSRPSWHRRTPVVCAPRVLARAYSVKQPSDGWPSFDFSQINKQIKINEELAKTGKKELGTGEREIIFVDVREPHELVETGQIPGAINVPINSQIKSFHISDEEFHDLFGYDRPTKDAHLMFYCKAGVRARTAAQLAQSAGWTLVSDYPGSWLDWEAQGGEVERVSPKTK